jgi:hypothetical protein
LLKLLAIEASNPVGPPASLKVLESAELFVGPGDSSLLMERLAEKPPKISSLGYGAELVD